MKKKRNANVTKNKTRSMYLMLFNLINIFSIIDFNMNHFISDVSIIEFKINQLKISANKWENILHILKHHQFYIKTMHFFFSSKCVYIKSIYLWITEHKFSNQKKKNSFLLEYSNRPRNSILFHMLLGQFSHNLSQWILISVFVFTKKNSEFCCFHPSMSSLLICILQNETFAVRLIK